MSKRTTLKVIKRRPPTTARGNSRFGNVNSMVSGVYADLSRRNVDQRSKLAKILRGIEGELVSAIGGDPSPQQKILIDRAVYKIARCTMFEAAHLTGQGEGADEHYLAWSNSLRLDLQALGLKRVPKAVQSLAEYLEQEDKHEETQA